MIQCDEYLLVNVKAINYLSSVVITAYFLKFFLYSTPNILSFYALQVFLLFLTFIWLIM